MNLSEIGRIADLTRPLNVGVAGINKLDLVVTKGAISRLGLSAAVSSIPILSTGSDEPLVGSMQIACGARNKCELASKADLAQDIYFGIENGVGQGEDGKWHYLAIIFAICDSGKHKVLGCAEKSIFLTDTAIAAQKLPHGFKDNTASEDIESQSIASKCEVLDADLYDPSLIELLENEILEVLFQIFPKMR